jgi:hypothetical protein
MDLETILPVAVGAVIGSVTTIAATTLPLVWGWWSKRSEN